MQTSPATSPAASTAAVLSIHCTMLTKILHLPSTTKIPQIISTIQQLIEFKHSHRMCKQYLNQLRQQITQLNFTIQEKMFELAKLRIYQVKGELDVRSAIQSRVVDLERCPGGDQMNKGLHDCSKSKGNNFGLNNECDSGRNMKDRVQICKQKIEIGKIMQHEGAQQKQTMKLQKEGSQNLILEVDQHSIYAEYGITNGKQGQHKKKSSQKPSKKQKKKTDVKMKNTDFLTQL